MKNLKRIMTAVATTIAVCFFAGRIFSATSIEVNTGYKMDSLLWNIAGDITGNRPNILSELTWSDLEIIQIGARLKNEEEGNSYIRFFFSYGIIFSGKNQDSDYWGDNRTNEYSKTNNSASEGSVIDASLGIGYFFRQTLQIKFIPLAGISFHSQNLSITDGYKTIPPQGSFSGLDSSYITRWAGPWLGIDALLQVNDQWKFDVSAELHFASFYAEGNWNTRYDMMHPVSFSQSADGYGIVLALGAGYFFTPRWSMEAYLDFQSWWVENGIHRFYFLAGNDLETRLNEVRRQSMTLSLRQTFKF